MKEFLQELMEYSHHFNQKLGSIFIGHPDKTSEKSVKLFNHLLNAHHIWNSRIEGTPNIFGVWQIHSLETLKEIDDVNFERSFRILDTFDLTKVIAYANTGGQVFQNSIRDILFHIVNHSTYHRGQIATEFRENGLEPVVTDFIFYKRTPLKEH